MIFSIESNDEINAIIQAYSDSILRLAYAYMKNQSEAEDIAQDVLIAYMTKAPRFESEASRKNWLMRVACNKCKDVLKSAGHKRIVAIKDDLGYLPEDAYKLISYVLALEEKYRIPIHMFYYEGFSIREIAQALHCREATVGTWLSRGRERLKALIGDDFVE